MPPRGEIRIRSDSRGSIWTQIQPALQRAPVLRSAYRAIHREGSDWVCVRVECLSICTHPISWSDSRGLAASAELPQLKGMSLSQITRLISDSGDIQVKQKSTGNQTWNHHAGPQVRIEPYGNMSMTTKNFLPLSKSGANAHVHKYDPGKVA